MFTRLALTHGSRSAHRRCFVSAHAHPQKQACPGSVIELTAQGLDVEDTITDMQETIFQGMGVGGKFGLSCLARINTTYPSDQPVMQALISFAERCARRLAWMLAKENMVIVQMSRKIPACREEAAVQLAELPHDAWLAQQQLRQTMATRQAEMMSQLQQLPADQREVGSSRGLLLHPRSDYGSV